MPSKVRAPATLAALALAAILIHPAPARAEKSLTEARRLNLPHPAAPMTMKEPPEGAVPVVMERIRELSKK